MSVKVVITARSKDASGALKLVASGPMPGTFADEVEAQKAIAAHLKANPLEPAHKRKTHRHYTIVPA